VFVKKQGLNQITKLLFQQPPFKGATMFTSGFRVAFAITTTVAIATGCASLSASSPIVTDRLKMVSAGHTGCLPDANDISNVAMNLDGSGLWNASCKGKIYLCSAVASGSAQSESFSCAPAAQ